MTILQSNIFVYTRALFSQLRQSAFGAAAWTAGLLAISLGPAWAEPPKLQLPIDCSVGETCWLVNLVDHRPGSGFADYTCGHMGYDGHTGTDIALANLAEMRKGVLVKASAAGQVTAIRDGLPETKKWDSAARAFVRGRECGNTVIVDHGRGWETQYCHLQAGTIAVTKGERIVAGDPLGLLGMSGATQFPHVHFAVRHNGSIIDPFTGSSNVSACGPVPHGKSLWSARAAASLSYPGPQIFHMGFSSVRPDISRLRAGQYNQTSYTTAIKRLYFWMEAYAVRAGDMLELSLTGPNGERIAVSRKPITKSGGRIIRSVVGLPPPSSWPQGRYTGTASIRHGNETVTRKITAVIAP